MPSSKKPPALPVTRADADLPARRPDFPVPDKMLKMAVRGYSETKKKAANGSGIKSPRLEAGGQPWRIVYYPNGMRAGTTESISLYLQLDADDDDAAAAAADVVVEARYKFMLLRPGGGIGFMSGTVEATFGREQNAHGFERFVTRGDLEESTCLVDDYLTIRCDVTVLGTRRRPPTGGGDMGRLREPSDMPAAPASGRPQEQGDEDAVRPLLHMDLGRLPATEEGADVDLDVGGVVFAAHRRVLAARSPALEADLFGRPSKEETTSYIRVDGINPEAFRSLLHYIYTGSLPETSVQEVDAMVLQHLLSAADRYDLKGLKAIVEDKLCDHICVANALAMLVLAEQHQCHKLKDTCFRFIACPENDIDRAVMTTDDVDRLAKSYPSVVRELIAKILDSRIMALKADK